MLTYDRHVQNAAGSGHEDIKSHKSHFKALGSDLGTDARDHTSTTYTEDDPDTDEDEEDLGVPIYWLNGAKVADHYKDFYDGSWDSNAPRDEDGESVSGNPEIWTGTNSDGTKHSSQSLGTKRVRVGKPATSGDELNARSRPSSRSLGIYGLSGLFTVVQSPPKISIADKSASEGNTVEFRVELDIESTAQVTVKYATAGETATEGTDYTAASGTLTFAASETEKTISVQTTQDALFEMDEVFTVTLSDPTNGEFADDAETVSATGTIRNDDPVPSVDVPAYWPLAPFSLSPGDSFRLLFVSSTTRDATSTDIGDYDTHVQNAAGSGDVSVQGYSSHFRTLGSTSVVDAVTHTGTTTSGDSGVPVFWLGGDKVADDYRGLLSSTGWISNKPRDESGSLLASGIQVHTGSNSNGTAYTDQYLGASGSRVRNGRPDEPRLEIDGGLGPPTGALGLYGLSFIFRIQTGGLPVLRPGAANATEGGTVEFTVTLSQQSAQEVTVQYATSSGTATDGTDYTAASGTLTFNVGDTSKTIEVNTTDDATFEGDETFTLTLSNPMNAALLGGGTQLAVEGTILENDPDPVPASWPLVPTDLGAGDSFRLLFVSSTKLDARSAEIAGYDRHVQDAAGGGHASVQEFSSNFKALASTATVDARDHTDTTFDNNDLGVPIYWLGGDRVSDDYSDFYDGSWASNSLRQESGTAGDSGTIVHSGSNSDGTKHPRWHLGSTENAVRLGKPTEPGGEIDSGNGVIVVFGVPEVRRLYGLSDIFSVQSGGRLP